MWTRNSECLRQSSSILVQRGVYESSGVTLVQQSEKLALVLEPGSSVKFCDRYVGWTALVIRDCGRKGQVASSQGKEEDEGK